jgi:2-C-methyl-D-erythritol 2,4-cyclodiphosphate synthase
LKTGIGYDIHRLEAGRPLVLGGIQIPSPKGLVGHSDGDVLIHAMIDALLGAMGEKDIGQCFPDTHPAFKNIRSTELLVSVAVRLKQHDFEILNLDTVVVAEAPRLAPHIPAMKDVLCPILGLGLRDLGIKAKTNEGVGELGRGEAIAAWASVLLFRGKPGAQEKYT